MFKSSPFLHPSQHRVKFSSASSQFSVGPCIKRFSAGGAPYLSHFPLTPGGGCVGRVEAVGSDTISLEPGQLVYVDPTIVGRDDPTQKIIQGQVQGFTPLSAKLSINGWRNGTMAEKATVPLENVIPLDENYLVGERGYSFDKIHMAYRFVLTYAGYELVKLKAGDTIIVAFATGRQVISSNHFSFPFLLCPLDLSIPADADAVADTMSPT